MSNDKKAADTNPTNPGGTGNPPAPGAVPQEDIDNTPTNPGKETEAAAIKAAQTSADRQFTPSMEKGADADFNTFVRRAHEQGNPEQLSPMQIEQNARDKAKPQPNLSSQHDLDHEDTRWVVQNVLGETIPEGA